MYDKRKIIIKPAMYCKWILRQKIANARREIPYLFSLCHNKDIRAVDSGIYASLMTAKMKNLTAGQLMKKIENKDETLEANLSTTMASVRGSNEYWNRLCQDLEIIDENFGPATFFVTLGPAEYDWEDLGQFLRSVNPDIHNVDKATISSLCITDPIMFSYYYRSRFESYLKNIMLNSQGPLGTVTDIC